MARGINRATGAILYLPRWAHILALVESLVLVAILVLVDIFLPGWDWIVLLWLPIAIFVSLLITKRKTRERKKKQLENQSFTGEVDFLCKQIKKMENRKQNYNSMKAVLGGVPRCEKKQTVTITEDLKVVVDANNGVYDGAEHVRFNGEFVMNAKSVCLLIAALEGKNIRIMSDYPFFDSLILGEEGVKEIANRIEEKKKECNETLELMKEKHAKEVESLKKENIKDWNRWFAYMFAYQGLMEMIERFNASRRPWERKMVVPDFEQKEESDITFNRIKELLKFCDYKPLQAQGNMKGGCKEFFVKEIDGDRYTVTIEKEKV